MTVGQLVHVLGRLVYTRVPIVVQDDDLPQEKCLRAVVGVDWVQETGCVHIRVEGGK